MRARAVRAARGRAHGQAAARRDAVRSVPRGSFDRLSRALTLWRAWLGYARGKRRWPAVARFALDADDHVLALHRALRSGRYAPAPYASTWCATPSCA